MYVKVIGQLAKEQFFIGSDTVVLLSNLNYIFHKNIRNSYVLAFQDFFNKHIHI